MFDNELSPAQQYNLEKLLGRTAIDRTAVILDIFAQNAHTLEGKAQVELALLRYRLPRLRRGADGQPVAAARRRRRPLRSAARPSSRSTAAGSAPHHASLESDLERPGTHTATCSARAAAAADSPAVTIVGYTNAGKSSLLNRLTDSGVLAENRCSPRSTRRPAGSRCPAARPVLLTDTVGFVRRLPHGLVEAFKSTLEVAAEAD